MTEQPITRDEFDELRRDVEELGNRVAALIYGEPSVIQNLNNGLETLRDRMEWLGARVQADKESRLAWETRQINWESAWERRQAAGKWVP